MWPDPFDFNSCVKLNFTALDIVVIGFGILFEVYAIVFICMMEKKLTQPDFPEKEEDNKDSVRVSEMTVTEYQIIRFEREVKSTRKVKPFYKIAEFDKSSEFDKSTVFDQYPELGKLLEIKC